jgi:eukaryotic-like serine/threonine-protein kinase
VSHCSLLPANILNNGEIMKECPYCKNKNSLQARYCLKCRTPLEPQDTSLVGTLLKDIPKKIGAISKKVISPSISLFSQKDANASDEKSALPDNRQTPKNNVQARESIREINPEQNANVVNPEKLQSLKDVILPPGQHSDDQVVPECVETGILETGTLLKERVKIQEMTNIGGMGYIYLGYDMLIQKNVAVKEMIDKFTNRKERMLAIEHFKREADLLCRLDNPAIPLFYDYFVENQRYYLIMDYIEGMDLRKILNKNQGKPLPMKQIVIWLLVICDVLTYLHTQEHPIIYRDLKPSNIIVTPNNEVKLVDFGIARLFVPRVKGTMVGTQGYAPPEQYRGEAEPRSDIYSLGATLHHLLSGKDPQLEAPFQFQPLGELNPNVPSSLERLIDRALRMNPDERFQSAAQMKQELERVIRNEDDLSGILQEIDSIEKEIKKLKEKKENLFVPEVVASERKMQKTREFKTPGASTTWKHFRGNESRTGLSTIPLSLQGRVKWRATVGTSITASPVIDSQGNIYIGAQDSYLYSFSPDGNLRWEFKTKAPIFCAAAIDDEDNILVPSEDGFLYCLDQDGTKLWSFNVRDHIKTTPLVIGENIYIAGQNGHLYCLASDGYKQWEFDSESPISCSPVMDLNNGNLYIGNVKGEFFAFTYNGNIQWMSYFPRAFTATPMVAPDSTIYVGCEDGHLYALSPDRKVKWSFKTKNWIRSSPAISRDGNIFVGSGDKFLYSINSKGKEKWRFNAEDVILGSPAVSDDGKIFFTTHDGFLIALQPHGKSLWWLNLESNTTSSPAISPSGNIVICSGNGGVFTII